MEKVAVIILNFNGKKDTIECLQSLQKSTIPVSIIVVDNGSREEFKVESSKLKVERLMIIRNKENLGFSGGNNVGIQYALENNFEYVVILNNDTIVDKNLIKNLFAAVKSDEKVGIVVPKVYFEKGYEFHKTRYKTGDLGKVVWYAGGIMDWNNVVGKHRGVDEVDSGQFEKVEETDFATGNCMLIPSRIFKKVGILDERYFLYYEDNDFSMRVKRAGYKIMYSPLAKLWHKNAASAGGSGSALQDYYISRNRLLFGMTYAPLRSKFALLREALNLFVSGRSWQRRGVLDFFLGKFGKGSFKIN